VQHQCSKLSVIGRGRRDVRGRDELATVRNVRERDASDAPASEARRSPKPKATRSNPVAPANLKMAIRLAEPARPEVGTGSAR
jgi:hypothetical protein